MNQHQNQHDVNVAFTHSLHTTPYGYVAIQKLRLVVEDFDAKNTNNTVLEHWVSDLMPDLDIVKTVSDAWYKLYGFSKDFMLLSTAPTTPSTCILLFCANCVLIQMSTKPTEVVPEIVTSDGDTVQEEQGLFGSGFLVGHNPDRDQPQGANVWQRYACVPYDRTF